MKDEITTIEFEYNKIIVPIISLFIPKIVNLLKSFL